AILISISNLPFSKSQPADQPSRQKYQHAARDHLKRRLQEWGIHVFVPYVADHAKLHRHDRRGHQRGYAKTGDRNGKGWPEAANGVIEQGTPPCNDGRDRHGRETYAGEPAGARTSLRVAV